MAWGGEGHGGGEERGEEEDLLCQHDHRSRAEWSRQRKRSLALGQKKIKTSETLTCHHAQIGGFSYALPPLPPRQQKARLLRGWSMPTELCPAGLLSPLLPVREVCTLYTLRRCSVRMLQLCSVCTRSLTRTNWQAELPTESVTSPTGHVAYTVGRWGLHPSRTHAGAATFFFSIQKFFRWSIRMYIRCISRPKPHCVCFFFHMKGPYLRFAFFCSSWGHSIKMAKTAGWAVDKLFIGDNLAMIRAEVGF